MDRPDTSACCGGPGYHTWNCRDNEHRVENLRQMLITEIGNTDWKAIDGRGLTAGEMRWLVDEAVRHRVAAGF